MYYVVQKVMSSWAEPEYEVTSAVLFVRLHWCIYIKPVLSNTAALVKSDRV